MNVLELRDVTITYGRGSQALSAVSSVDLTVPRGATVGIVGESGSGKSSLARAVVGLIRPTAGTITLDTEPVDGEVRSTGRRGRPSVQMVFQDPFSSLDPRMTIGESIAEGLLWRRLRGPARRAEVERMLTLVSLDATAMNRLPGQLSGGQLQRVAIARALAAEPDLLVADEITASLDVSVQASVLNLVRELQRRLHLSMLFVSHNLAVVRYVSDVIAVMHLGQIVEFAPTEELVRHPQHPYTKMLLDAVPAIDSPTMQQVVEVPEGPLDSPVPTTGCRFQQRCPVGPATTPGREICVEVDPAEGASGREHRAACHFVPERAKP